MPHRNLIKNMMKSYITILLCSLALFSNVDAKILWEKVWFEHNSYYILEIDKADTSNLMALVGIGGFYTQVLKSIDAGKSWNIIFNDTTFILPVHYPFSMSYPEKDFAIVMCDSGTFLKTNDGGAKWQKGDIKELHSENFTTMVTMFDKNNGLIYGSKKLFISHDGFETYKQIYFPVYVPVLDFQMLSSNFIFAMTVYYDGNPNYDEKFFKSSDGGESWTEYYYPDYIFPRKICFIDTLFGYTAGSASTGLGDNRYDLIYRTSNGGKTWDKVLDTLCWPPYGLQDIDILDRNTAIAVGQFGKIYWTHDGGNSWQRDSNTLIEDGIPATLRVCILGENTALIGDWKNRIWRSYLTTDVEDDVPDSDQMISPNPAYDFIGISVGANDRSPLQSSIKVFNVFGQKLMTVGVQNFDPIRIDVSGLPPGMYFVRIGDRVSKFIKV